MLKLEKEKVGQKLSPQRGHGHHLLHAITESCSTVNVFLTTFQFLIIKNGLQLIHSFAAIR